MGEQGAPACPPAEYVNCRKAWGVFLATSSVRNLGNHDA